MTYRIFELSIIVIADTISADFAFCRPATANMWSRSISAEN